MIFTILSEAADKGHLLLWQGALCRYHIRRDGVLVIHELLVLPDKRRQGTGRRMVTSLQEHHPGLKMRAVCPSHYPACKFWSALGFKVARLRSKGLNTLLTWEKGS